MSISIRKAEPRAIAAVSARVRSDQIPAHFKRYPDQVYSAFTAVGDVHPVALPVGEAAMTTRRGPYQDVRRVHQVVVDWCAANGHEIAGPHWEVYWVDGAQPTVDVYYLLR